ncbi:MAG: RICIN domain-containing protein, partial [Eubacteriales bacterium]|nr:RICIN domain-containing protein [Eubacteriales bacterium]
MKEKSRKAKIITLCLVCFILLTPLSIAATEYSAKENGDVMAGTPESNRIYTIGTQNANNRVFDVQNALTADNSVVWTYPYNGDECQEWIFIKQGLDYAIQDSHSGKYLTVKDNVSSANAEVVISSRPASGFSAGQLFRVEQIGTSMRYRLFSKCSNYTLAIGYNSSWYLRQLATTDSSTQIYLTESAPYHGLQEGYIHIQQYNTVYSTGDKMLGFVLSSNALSYSKFSNSATFEWYVKYHGNGYFSISQNGCYLRCSGTSAGASVATQSGFSDDYCLWKIINNDD